MKVSTNWIKSIVEAEQTSANLIPRDINELVEKIGAQLGAVDEVINVGEKYQGIVIAKVIKCDKHPNADKLSVCMIDVGKAKPVQVVCGAPNVADGQLVAWIPPGVAVPSTFDKDPLVLESREIRGVVSNGMIASPKELGIGDEHEGILVLADEQQQVTSNKQQAINAGDSFAKAFGFDDYIIDIENKMFTHRPDCFGMLGVARELAGIQHIVFRSPKWYLSEKTTGNHKTDDKLLTVKNEITELVPRFMMQIIKNVKVGPSSVGIQSALARVGVRPVNNVVDATNYFMLETAQPVHAYDYDKVKKLSGASAKIIVRKAKKGEKLMLLGGKEITLEGDEVVIATDKKAIGLGGVMGGAETEVDEKTKNIILEVGNFDMNAIRLTATHHGLFTDAATRFTKNQSPWQNDRVLARTIDEIVHEAGGMPARTIYDLKGKLQPAGSLKTDTGFINERLGLKLSARDTAKLLENVEFKVQVRGNVLSIEAPFWRTDISIPEDIVEEVGRLHGYDRLPLELPVKDLTPPVVDQKIELKSRLRSILSTAGVNEVLTYSFVHGNLLGQAGQDKKLAFRLVNALSPDLQYYRLSLTPSLLEKIHPNIKTGFDEFAIYEIGTAHSKTEVDEDGIPKEFDRLALVLSQKQSQLKSGQDAAFFRAKKYVSYLFDKLSLEASFRSLKEAPMKDHKLFQQMLAPFEPAHSAIVFSGDKIAGVVGEYKAEIANSLKLPTYTAGFELFLSTLQSANGTKYQPLNRFPSLDQDICLRTSADLSYSDLTEFLRKELNKAARPHGYGFRLEPLDIFQRPSDKSHKQTTWRITLWHPDRTLTTEETNRLLDKIAIEAKKQLNAERV